MRSSVNWAVLGLVIERPSYGYEVGLRFERRFEGILRASMPHIYGALNTLEEKQFIEPLPGQKTSGRQPKVHYRATPTGARAYRDWLAREMRADPTRAELVGRLISAYAVDADAAERLLDAYASQCLAEQTRTPLPAGDDRSMDGRMGELLLEERRLALRAQLEWVDYAKQKFAAWAREDRSKSPVAMRKGAEGAGEQ